MDFEVLGVCDHYLVVSTPYATETRLHALLGWDNLGAVPQGGVDVVDNNTLHLYWRNTPTELQETLQKAIQMCRQWGIIR